ncbi:Long-chain-fatty-acid--CoA ligase 1 [Bulinus truncatus]|nr:Long-chain-fatty-acid--CoA ligase 1 [Bulinus truncatus]
MSEEDFAEIWQNNRALIATGAATLAGVATFAYLLSGTKHPQVHRPAIDLKDQSVVIDGKPEHRASKLSSPPDYFQRECSVSNLRVVSDVLEIGKIASGNGLCLGSRTGPNKTYEWMTYQQVLDQATQFGAGLIVKGSKPQNNTFIGIYATNRPEWTIADYGSHLYSMVPVPLYDTLGLDACKFIINQCEIEVIIVDNEARVKTLVSLKPNLPTLKRIVMIEPLSEMLKEEVAKAGIEIFTFTDILKFGQSNPQPSSRPNPEDIFSIIYTSGTTGDPKGVVLTHFGFLSMVQSMLLQSQPTFVCQTDDVYLSYLPLAHNFDRGCHILMLLHGGRIGYYSRDVRLLTEDLMELRPTLFATVPRVLNRLYDTVYAQVKNSRIKSTMLRWALESKQKEVERYIYRKDSIWDKLIFNKVQNKLGGKIRMVLTGSAPLSAEVLRFLRCALGCVVLEGYGQTETGAGISMSLPGDPSAGSVGPPLPGSHIKLIDVPEMDYYVKDNIGEICAKADFIMKGYYKEPEKTAEALDEDGWLHTGDVGTWLPGEYIATEKIENVYQSSPFVAQVFVDGDSMKPVLMAVIVPDQLYLENWTKQNKEFPSGIQEFCQTQGAKEVVLKDIIEKGKNSGLKGFEQVKDIYLEWNMFTVENDLLTPTLKNRRPALRKKYKSIIADLYKQNGM